MKNQISNSEADRLRSSCPLPSLLRTMHLDKFAKPSCVSPLRVDAHPSWGIYQKDQRHFWKDHGNGDGGDEISFLAQYLGLDPKTDFPTILKIYQHFSNNIQPQPINAASIVTTPVQKPDQTGFGPGTEDQLSRLSALRGISIDALRLAQGRGFLVFGNWYELEVFGVKDQSGNVLEIRRLDGKPFEACGGLTERKSHAIRGSQKNWPVGILESQDRPQIAMVEGLPDFLALFEVIQTEKVEDTVAPIAMLSAAASIPPGAMSMFSGKDVKLFPHADNAGAEAAGKWEAQLKAAGVKRSRFVDFTTAHQEDGPQIKDLCDYLPIYRLDIQTHGEEGRLLTW